jgi:Ala-tRNA(Pro) deacylase
MPYQKLKDFLRENAVEYVSINHPPGYTAQEIAALAHIPGREMAKTVVVKVDGRFALVVVPANYKVDMKLVQDVCGADSAELATEDEFRELFPDCELGAMPPFGNLFNLPEYIDESLCADEMITFNAGSHTELIRLPFKKFEELAAPTIARLHS